MKIKFCGAAKTVTGSQHLLEVNGKKLLLDCGLFQGRRSESYDKNRSFYFDPGEIDAVIISHAHIDHSGNLPTLHKNGFNGNIYATPATTDLCRIMLQDSGYIQEKDIEFINKRKLKKGEQPFKPLYTVNEAWQVMQNFRSIGYYSPTFLPEFGDSIKLTFFDAGHILGSAQILLEVKENGKNYRFAFTGDVGRPGLPILRDPEFIGNVNFLISESTYGNRVHDKAYKMDTQLAKVVNDAAVKNGKIIVPAFSVGRTQELIYSLNKLFSERKIPMIPVYVDSPLSVNATGIFKMHTECFDIETVKLLQSGVDLFGNTNVTYIRDVNESKKLNFSNEPCIIISASGMCESGRVLHHLSNNIENPSTTVLIVGFMAQHTLGRRLRDAADTLASTVNIFGDPHIVNAKIVILDSFSAHADKDELHDYFNKFNRKEMESIWLVHGEEDQQEVLQKSLSGMNFKKVFIPFEGEEFEI